MAELFSLKNLRFPDILEGGTPSNTVDTRIAVPEENAVASETKGLMALGATLAGATVVGSRFKAIRNLFKTPPITKVPPAPIMNKPAMATETIPTATGQASELISTSRQLVPSKSRMGEVEGIPFTQGKGYQGELPVVGSSTYDRIMEAPFDIADAKQWTDFLLKGTSGGLKVSTGPLTGVSRQVKMEELADLNMLTIGKDGKMGGFLKIAEDTKIPVDRSTLLNLVKNSPINNIKEVRFTSPGDITSDIAKLKAASDDIVEKFKQRYAGKELDESFETIKDNMNSIRNKLDDVINDSEIMIGQGKAIPVEKISSIQDSIRSIVNKDPGYAPEMSNLLVNLNKITGRYNNASAAMNPNAIFKSGPIKFNPAGGRSTFNSLPQYRNFGNADYNLLAGENFTEKAFVYDAKIPNTTRDSFSYVKGKPHYFSNKELFFARYDDLPNPMLGGKRHLRVSEVQSDLHAAATSSIPGVREEFFKKKINVFNQQQGPYELYRKERNKLVAQKEQYRIGRGYLTPAQESDLRKINFKIQELDRTAIGQIARESGQLSSTSYGPLAGSYNDYVVKNLLREMSQRKINAISVVPSSMNQNLKGTFSRDKFGNEANYGLMSGRPLVPEKIKIKDEYMPDITGMTAEQRRGVRKVPAEYQTTGRMIESKNKFSSLNESLNRIAKQYGAEFKPTPMPKSNPYKTFKIIEERKFDDTLNGRKHYNKKIGDNYIYEDHLAAFETEAEARAALRVFQNRAGDKVKVQEISPESPKNYETVMTLIAPDDVLKKFALPFKAYMFEGGFVDKTNIFKSII